jgi:hypothetical protein
MKQAIIRMAIVLAATIFSAGLTVAAPSSDQIAQANPCSEIDVTSNENVDVECEFDDDVEIAAVAGNGLTGEEIPLDELPLSTP